MSYTLGVSLICMDHINLEQHVHMCEDLGIDYIHLDAMDGHFVPRYGVYPEIVGRIADITDMKMDLHLMVSDPENAINQFAPHLSKIEYVNFHYEAARENCFRVFDRIRELGSKPGLAVNLSTNIFDLGMMSDSGEMESVCLMGIHPGILKQNPRQQYLYNKLNSLSMIGFNKFVQIDGGVQLNESVRELYRHGANNFVCGTSTLYKGVSFKMTPLQQYTIMDSNLKELRKILSGDTE